jgi:diguanylate cyclase
LISGQIESAEALVRWNHPVRGYIRPDLFIPLAERNERIDRLTLAVTEATLVALGKLESISIAVNLSAKLVVDDRFNRSLDALLDRHASVVERLIFEVTESAAMRDMDVAVMTLKSYRRRGIAISLDDYGTGQSTLSYLRELPLAELKIDRLFVQNAHQNDSDGVLVRSTIELAHQLGLRVVAEGVENLECLTFLKTLGCDYVQGWLVSKPLPFEAFAHLFDSPRVAA